MFHHVLTTDFHLDLTRLMGSPLTKSPLLRNTFKTIPLPHTHIHTYRDQPYLDMGRRGKSSGGGMKRREGIGQSCLRTFFSTPVFAMGFPSPVLDMHLRVPAFTISLSHQFREIVNFGPIKIFFFF